MADPANRGDHPGYLVYVRSWTGRVCPQWWAELYYGERNHLRRSVVAVFELTDADIGSDLSELARRYPLQTEPRR